LAILCDETAEQISLIRIVSKSIDEQDLPILSFSVSHSSFIAVCVVVLTGVITLLEFVRLDAGQQRAASTVSGDGNENLISRSLSEKHRHDITMDLAETFPYGGRYH
jgi:hypothetical protein